MIQFRQGKGFRLRRTLRRCGKRRIFRRDPAQKSSPLVGIFRNKIYARRRRKQRDSRRVDDLEKIKAKCMAGGGKREKSSDGELARALRFPGEKEIVIHLAEVVASATEVIPFSSAAFVTTTTSS